jgi:Protein of unknown function (DUF3313)
LPAGGRLRQRLDVGEVMMEAELLDGADGTCPAKVVDLRTGGKNLREASSTWGDVQGAFEVWAERLRARLEEAHAPAKS